jgi:uncharacterized repeat protein (TIGR03803 family)
MTLYSTGNGPMGGVVFDNMGSLFGVTAGGGQFFAGTLYRLSPSGSGWTEQTLHNFTGELDGLYPYGGLIRDTSGTLYGTTPFGGLGGGTVFSLTPAGNAWIFTTIYQFPPCASCGPVDKLLMDGNGNLYGTTLLGGVGGGSVFKLTRANDGWTYSSLHDFTGGADGAFPSCSLVFDAEGNLYGTTMQGGDTGLGVVFEVAP